MLNAYSWFGLGCFAACMIGFGACADAPRAPTKDLGGNDSPSTDGDGDGDSSGDGDDSSGPSTSYGDGDGDGYGSTGDGDGDGEFGGGGGVDAGDPLGGLAGLGGLGGLGGFLGGGGASDAGTSQPTGDAGNDCTSSPRVCWDVFDCYIFHPGDLGCGYTSCEGFVCK